jgi:hypothetical protein
MRKPIQFTVAAVAASAAGFAVHKVFADRLPAWVSAHMGNTQIKLPPYGPEIVVPAALTSLESGVAYLAAYLLVRRATPQRSVLLRSLLVAALCLALRGSLLRMPVMQLLIGNPVWVTLVQHAGAWAPVVAASLVVSYAYEFLGWLLAKPATNPDGRDASERHV